MLFHVLSCCFSLLCQTLPETLLSPAWSFEKVIFYTNTRRLKAVIPLPVIYPAFSKAHAAALANLLNFSAAASRHSSVARGIKKAILRDGCIGFLLCIRK
jgi:hypothetical protein